MALLILLDCSHFCWFELLMFERFLGGGVDEPDGGVWRRLVAGVRRKAVAVAVAVVGG
jgi:hypothetical protein